jgi:catechol 2,3-dioxygenase-like lactoylglutathione lyase family enzyme
VPPFTRFDHVQLAIPAGAEERARSFYIGVLGFEELAKPPHLAQRGGLWLRSGSVDLHLGVDPRFHAAHKAHPALRCRDYGALLESLRDRGVEFVEDSHPIGKAPHCYVYDPFGNRIELIGEDAGE